MSTTPTIVTPVKYPQKLGARQMADHMEIEILHSHSDPSSFAADLRLLRSSSAPDASFGTSLADALVSGVSKRHAVVTR